MEERLNVNKYKVFLLILKFIPMLLAIIEFIHSIAILLGYNLLLLRWLGGASLIPLLFIYIAADVFKFCNYHKMFIYYILAIESIAYIDSLIILPISNLTMISIISMITLVFLFIILFKYVTNNKKVTSRPDR